MSSTQDMKFAERVSLWTLDRLYRRRCTLSRVDVCTDAHFQKRGVDFWGVSSKSGRYVYIDEKVKNTNRWGDRPGDWRLGLEYMAGFCRGYGWFADEADTLTTHYSFVWLKVSDESVRSWNLTEAHIAGCSALIFPKKSAKAAVAQLEKKHGVNFGRMAADVMAGRSAGFYSREDDVTLSMNQRNDEGGVQLNLPLEWYLRLPGASYLDDVR